MRELVDKHELRPARENRVEIHLGEEVTLVLDLPAGYGFEADEQRLGLAPSMRLDDADDDVDALAALRLRRHQHLVGLANPRRGADKYLEATAGLAFGRRQQRLRGRPCFSLGHIDTLARP